MTDPVAGPMSVDDADLSDDLPEDSTVGDADEALPSAEADWVEENEGSLDDDPADG